MTSNPISFLFFAIFVVLFAIFGATFFLSESQYLWLIDEGGIIESLSAAGYFLCFIYAVTKGGCGFFKRYHYLILLMVLFGLRELDFDKRFTSMGILKSKFLVSPEVPFIEKFFGGLVILLLVYIAVRLITPALQMIKTFPAWVQTQWLAFAGFTLLAFTKTIDGAARKLAEFGFTISGQTQVHLETLEELLECGISFVFMLAFVAYFATQNYKNSSLGKH